MKSVAHDYLLSNRDRHWWHVGKLAFVTRLLEGFAGTHTMLLDIGSSHAFLADVLREGSRVVSLDRNFNVLHAANTKLAVCADAVALPFASHSFDLVTALDLLEHISEDFICLKEAFRILKPGGLMIIMVPAYPFLWSDLDEIGNHVRRYTPGTLMCLFHKIPEMQVVKFTHFNLFLFPLIFPIRVFQRLFKRISPNFRTESMRLPPRIINDWLTRLFLLEGRIAFSYSLPIGVSIVAVAKKRMKIS